MTAVAFIHPDFEIVRVQVLSVYQHPALIPPVPLSGRHVHPDRAHPPGVGGVRVAVNVTEFGPWMLAGAAVTLRIGGVTVTCAESARSYSPIVAVAFIHPDRETSRLQVLSVYQHPWLIPPVTLSGRHVQLDRLQVIPDGVAVAVNVTESGPWMVDGEAVALSVGGVTVSPTACCTFTPLTVAKTVSVPERVNGRRQVRVPAPDPTQLFEEQGDDCVPNAGDQVVESICKGTFLPPTWAGDTVAVTVTVSA
ncbi:MAG TPA: hypothetical protein VN964_05115 [Gemmatimonadales bacterium]|nr:hypothetical protein [Gemmatimonadales bacterium]